MARIFDTYDGINENTDFTTCYFQLWDCVSVGEQKKSLWAIAKTLPQEIKEGVSGDTWHTYKQMKEYSSNKDNLLLLGVMGQIKKRRFKTLGRFISAVKNELIIKGR